MENSSKICLKTLLSHIGLPWHHCENEVWVYFWSLYVCPCIVPPGMNYYGIVVSLKILLYCSLLTMFFFKIVMANF